MGKAQAVSYAAVSVGHYNEVRGTENGKHEWVDLGENAIFEVGIGSSANDRKNALTVMKDGSVEIGKATADGDGTAVPLMVNSDGTVVLSKEQGDISMGIYGGQQ